MRYWVRGGQDAQGPFTLEELDAQGLSDSTLVCPEGRPRARRENWLPLRKAKAPPRFYARVGSKVRGPYTAEELGRLEGFCSDTLLCPERKNFRSRWNWTPARSFPALRPSQAQPATESVPAWSRDGRDAFDALVQRGAELAGLWRQPSTLAVAAALGALMTGVLLWMQFSYLPQVRQTYQRVHTVMGLRVIAALQERYRQETGRYAPDFDALVQAAGPWLPELMSDNLDLETLLVQGTTDHFKIEANALDELRTLYQFTAAAPGSRQKAAAVSASTAPASGHAP